jgi:enoyl-CoA hydratase/carnithine racemase
VRVIVFTGLGRAFLAGADTEALRPILTTSGALKPAAVRHEPQTRLAARYAYYPSIPAAIACQRATAGIGLVHAYTGSALLPTTRSSPPRSAPRLIAEHGIS